MNSLEKLNQELTGTNFIKSYPSLNKLKITPTQKQLIELVLSYQDNNQDFYMNYKDIAELLYVKTQSIKNAVISLKKAGFITVTNSTNFNGISGGSSSTLSVNIEFIIKKITESKSNTETTLPVLESIKKDTTEPEPESDVKSDVKSESDAEPESDVKSESDAEPESDAKSSEAEEFFKDFFEDSEAVQSEINIKAEDYPDKYQPTIDSLKMLQGAEYDEAILTELESNLGYFTYLHSVIQYLNNNKIKIDADVLKSA